jgi:hypothetical protein
VTLAVRLGYYRRRDSTSRYKFSRRVARAEAGASADVVAGFYDHTIQMAAEARSASLREHAALSVLAAVESPGSDHARRGTAR